MVLLKTTSCVAVAQEAFAMTPEEVKAAPDPQYITKLKGGGKTYKVYVHRCGLPMCSLRHS